MGSGESDKETTVNLPRTRGMIVAELTSDRFQRVLGCIGTARRLKAMVRGRVCESIMGGVEVSRTST